MRIQIFSDLHLEFAPFVPPLIDADVTILAGDTSTGVKGVQWALNAFQNRPVLYILGNHEFYGHATPSLIEKLRALSSGTNVRVLENETFHLGDITFLGATLWTDFELNGNVLDSSTAAKLEMTDFRRIRLSPSYGRFSPKDARFNHQRSRAWLETSLINVKSKTVVITHHAPSRQSTRDPAKSHPLDPAYASDLELLIQETKPALWIHGHIHCPRDYTIGSTRIVNNARGYPDEFIRNFREDLVIEI